MAVGMKLADALRGPGSTPIVGDRWGAPPFNPTPPSAGMTPDPTMASKGLFGIKPGSKGAIIAGILGDALSRATGGQAAFVPHMLQQRQRKDELEAEEARWTRRRESELADRESQRAASLADWMTKEQFERANPKPSELERNLQVWQTWTPEQRAAYSAMQDAERGPITVLPNGLAYARDPEIMRQITGAAPAAAPPPALKPGTVIPDPRKQGGGAASRVTGNFLDGLQF